MAEPIKMPFVMQTPVGPRNHALDGVNIPYAKGQFWGGKYRDCAMSGA